MDWRVFYMVDCVDLVTMQHNTRSVIDYVWTTASDSIRYCAILMTIDMSADSLHWCWCCCCDDVTRCHDNGCREANEDEKLHGRVIGWSFKSQETILLFLKLRSTLFLHGVCMLRECIWWVCTRAARKENLTLTLSLTHTITAYSVSGNIVRMRILICATRQKPCRKRVYLRCFKMSARWTDTIYVPAVMIIHLSSLSHFLCRCIVVSINYCTVSLKSLEQWAFASQTKHCAAVYLSCTHAVFSPNTNKPSLFIIQTLINVVKADQTSDQPQQPKHPRIESWLP